MLSSLRYLPSNSAGRLYGEDTDVDIHIERASIGLSALRRALSKRRVRCRAKYCQERRVVEGTAAKTARDCATYKTTRPPAPRSRTTNQ
jgi:hypothetical protein